MSYYNDAASRALFVTDSTTRAMLALDPDSGERNDSLLLSMPSDVWECGLVVAVGQPQSAVYVFDRYRGYAAKFAISEPGNSTEWEWTSGPAPYWNSVLVTYLASATVSNTEHGIVYVVDGPWGFMPTQYSIQTG